MKKIGIYPGSFNPWHKGHRDVLDKALTIFDTVYILVLKNPEKPDDKFLVNSMITAAKLAHVENVIVKSSEKTLKEATLDIANGSHEKMSWYTIIRGLRNGHDLQYEMNNQYWNEDLGLNCNFVYFITDRSLAHVSSSAIRSVNKLGLKHGY